MGLVHGRDPSIPLQVPQGKRVVPRHTRSLGRLSIPVNRLAKCADERSALGSLGMAAPISKDPAEAEAADLFKRLIDASDWTHQSFAAETDVSPGRVSQWATNRGPVPWDKAERVAELLGTEPDLISPAWRRLRTYFMQSLLLRLTPEIVAASEGAAKKLAGLSPRQKLDVVTHAEPIAQAIQLTLRKVLAISEGNARGLISRDGADRRFNRAAGAGKDEGQREAATGEPRKRAAGGS